MFDISIVFISGMKSYSSGVVEENRDKKHEFHPLETANEAKMRHYNWFWTIVLEVVQGAFIAGYEFLILKCSVMIIEIILRKITSYFQLKWGTVA